MLCAKLHGFLQFQDGSQLLDHWIPSIYVLHNRYTILLLVDSEPDQ